MIFKTETLELRGLKDNISGKGNIYYILYCEQSTGEPCSFYCPHEEVFPKGLKKGDIVRVVLDYNDKFKSLVVKKVELVNKGEG